MRAGMRVRELGVVIAAVTFFPDDREVALGGIQRIRLPREADGRYFDLRFELARSQGTAGPWNNVSHTWVNVPCCGARAAQYSAWASELTRAHLASRLRGRFWRLLLSTQPT